MVQDKTEQPRLAHKVVQVQADLSTWLWRIGSVVTGAAMGTAVASSMIWKKFYDGLKNTPGGREIWRKYADRFNTLEQEQMASKKFSAAEFSGEKKAIQKEKTQEFSAFLKEIYDIPDKTILDKIKGTWKRFDSLGKYNKAEALIRGVVLTGVTVGAGSILHENNRLWNRLDESRRQQAQDRENMNELMTQVSDNHSKLLQSTAIGQEFDRAALSRAANDHPMNDGREAAGELSTAPLAKVRVNELQHHDRLAHAGHMQHHEVS